MMYVFCYIVTKYVSLLAADTGWLLPGDQGIDKTTQWKVETIVWWRCKSREAQHHCCRVPANSAAERSASTPKLHLNRANYISDV